MKLEDAFSGFELTQGQSILIEKLEEFLQSNSTCFLLKGYAGTGKTFMMKGLTDYLSGNNRSFRISAPTGRAAKVISKKTKQKAYTIHKTIYSSKDLKEFKVLQEDGSETYKFYYELKNNEDTVNTIYIVDESSMLSDVYSEGEFFRFGTGFLLRDFLRYVNFDNNDHSKKVIFIGDIAQLPPVNMSFSPALDSKYLKETCQVESTEFELTDVIRQKSSSGILYNATRLRESLHDKVFNKLNIDYNFKDIIKAESEEILIKYLEACHNSIDDETIIVAYSNSSVKEYNDFVRSHFFPNQPFLSVGDKIILVSNNYNYPQIELLNGDFGFIKQVFSTNEIRDVKLKRKSKDGKIAEVDIKLSFRNVIIAFTDEEQIIHNVECKILENLLYSHKRDLSSDESKAIYIDFKIRHSLLKPGTKEFKDALRSDPYFNSLRIKFGYAITCHKSQGGEWKNTFLNCKSSMGYSNPSYFRWLYTGITRAKENLYLIDDPNLIYGKSSGVKQKFDNVSTRTDIIVLSGEILEVEIPFEIPDEIPFLKNIFLAVNDVIKELDIYVSSVKHTSYLEHYTFSQGNENVVFKFHYNTKNKITRIEKPSTDSQWIDLLGTILLKLETKTIIIQEESDNLINETNFQFESSFLKEFYEKQLSMLNGSGIIISEIEHKQYHELYVFKRNGLTASYKFHYNGKGEFGRVELIQNRTTGLSEEINSIISNNKEG